MLNWLSSTSKGKESSSNGSNTTGNAVIYVDDKDPEITAEPIFDEEPALYIVFPHANNPGSQAPKVTKITGKFLMILKKPNEVLSVVAKVIPHYWFKFGKLKERGTKPPLLCQLLDTPQTLAAGEYELPFTFDFPCDSWNRAYTVCPEGLDRPEDESPFFSQYYTFELHITRQSPSTSTSISSTSSIFSSSSSTSPKQSISKTSPSSLKSTNDTARPQTIIVPFPTKKDMIYMQKHFDNWRNGYNRRFFALVASPVDPGELPPPLERAIEEFAPQLGPINLILTSRSLTISALINFNVTFPAFPVTSKLQEIRGYVEGDGQWQSLQPNGLQFPGLPYRLPSFTIKSSDVITEDSAADSSDATNTTRMSASIAYRLPDDRNIGASTLKGTTSPAKSKHALLFEFEVLDGSGKRKIIKIREPVEIASCFLIPEYLNLPTYGTEPIPKSELQPRRPSERFSCVCGFSFEQLIQRENEGIMKIDKEYEAPDIKGPEHRVGMD